VQKLTIRWKFNQLKKMKGKFTNLFFTSYERNLKKKNLDFLDELRLFIEEEPIFTKKKFPSLCNLSHSGVKTSFFDRIRFLWGIFFNEFVLNLKLKFMFWFLRMAAKFKMAYIVKKCNFLLVAMYVFLGRFEQIKPFSTCHTRFF
jgi:hypothetical protein